MQIISAALAFAIVMLILSMICSTLVETIHRIFGLRERGLHAMVGQLFDRVLAEFAKKDGGRITPAMRAAFQNRMTANRSPVGVTTGTKVAKTGTELPGMDSAKIQSWLADIWRGRGLSKLTAHGFMERLGSDPLGDRIVKVASEAATQVESRLQIEAGKAMDAVLQDVAQKFEVFARDASVFFERRARTMSVLVAIILAFALHVSALELITTFMRDPAAADNVIKLKEGVLAKYEESLSKKIEAAKNDPDALEKLNQDLKAVIGSAKQDVAQLSDLGVPIGWTDPRKLAANPLVDTACRKTGQPDRPLAAGQKCAADEQSVSNFWPAMGVWLSILLGGLLIGLGGPFWYDAIKSLTSIRNIGRPSPAPGTPPQADGSPAPAGPAGSTETPQPHTPVDIFKVANAGRAAAQPAE